MLGLLAAVALIPWTHPLAFRPAPGWQTGTSGTVGSQYDDSKLRAPKQSSAWMAMNVRYRDSATADPPNTTLKYLPRNGVIVWAVIYQAGSRQKSIQLDLRRARHLPCCEGERVAGGVSELTGAGPRNAYSVIVRVYFGSRPTRILRAQAQRALNLLQLPAPR